jgi:hypothetical protein
VKVIELKNGRPTVDKLIGMAKDELVVLRKPDGSMYALSHVDEFDVEVELLRNNAEFMKLMKKLSRQKAVISLQDLRKELGL